MADRKYHNFADFWLFYVREHSDPRNRRVHFVGTSLVILLFAVALVRGSWLSLILMPLAGYGFAWFGHSRLERNRPATFTYPLWSLLADFKMWALILRGRMQSEVERAKASEPFPPT